MMIKRPLSLSVSLDFGIGGGGWMGRVARERFQAQRRIRRDGRGLGRLRQGPHCVCHSEGKLGLGYLQAGTICGLREVPARRKAHSYTTSAMETGRDRKASTQLQQVGLQQWCLAHDATVAPGKNLASATNAHCYGRSGPVVSHGITATTQT
jgi:hypothetical protein